MELGQFRVDVDLPDSSRGIDFLADDYAIELDRVGDKESGD